MITNNEQTCFTFVLHSPHAKILWLWETARAPSCFMRVDILAGWYTCWAPCWCFGDYLRSQRAARIGQRKITQCARTSRRRRTLCRFVTYPLIGRIRVFFLDWYPVVPARARAASRAAGNGNQSSFLPIAECNTSCDWMAVVVFICMRLAGISVSRSWAVRETGHDLCRQVWLFFFFLFQFFLRLFGVSGDLIAFFWFSGFWDIEFYQPRQWWNFSWIKRLIKGLTPKYLYLSPGGVLPMWWVIHMCRGFDPLFSLWQDRARSFWGIFLIHQQQSYLLGYKNYQFLQNSIFLAPNSIFSSIFLGPIFSGQRHTPISFQAQYPPPPPRGSHSGHSYFQFATPPPRVAVLSIHDTYHSTISVLFSCLVTQQTWWTYSAIYMSLFLAQNLH